MNENENLYDTEIITLVDEKGNDVDFELLLMYEYGERTYLAMLPVDNSNIDLEDGEVLIMRREEDLDTEDEFSVLPIETEEELEGAWNAFNELYYECDGECENCDEEDCEDREE